MTNDERERLRMMADTKQVKWDLSPNDQKAIAAALASIDALERELSEAVGDEQLLVDLFRSSDFASEGRDADHDNLRPCEAATRTLTRLKLALSEARKECERLSRSYGKIKDHLMASVAMRRQLRERAEKAEATIKSLSVMLGWMNVPPQATLETEIRCLRSRAEKAEAERDAAQEEADGWKQRNGITRSNAERAAAASAAQVERLREWAQRWMQDHQCAVKSDGPHTDCICHYCRLAATLSEKVGTRRRLTQAEVMILPDGTAIEVSWPGNPGPFRYKSEKNPRDGYVYAKCADDPPGKFFIGLRLNEAAVVYLVSEQTPAMSEVRRQERERCADVPLQWFWRIGPLAHEIADAIRALGEQPGGESASEPEPSRRSDGRGHGWGATELEAKATPAPLPANGWEFACGWYKEDEIKRALERQRSAPHDSERMPEDVYSAEFAKWLTLQYRLAMTKGIQIGSEAAAIRKAKGECGNA